MLKPDTHLVTETNGPRPAGRPGECFYCHAKLGEPHREGCVCRVRTVVVRASVEYVIEVPEDWNIEAIESARNESSWCANNTLDELKSLSETGCLCPFATFAYVREATEDDEAACGGAVNGEADDNAA